MKHDELLKAKGLKIRAKVVNDPPEFKEGQAVKVEKDVDLVKVVDDAAYCRVDGKLYVIPKSDLIGYKGELDFKPVEKKPTPPPAKEIGKLYYALLPGEYVKGKLVKAKAVVKVLAVEDNKVKVETQDEKAPITAYIPKEDLIEEVKAPKKDKE